MGTSNTDWSKFATLKSVIVFAATVVLFFAIVFFVGINSRKNIELFGLKIKSVDTVRIEKIDTFYKFRVDTLVRVVYLPSGTGSKKAEQKNVNGLNASVGRDNTGIIAKNVFSGKADSGSKIHVGDDINPVRTLSVKEENEILDSLRAFMDRRKISHVRQIQISLSHGSSVTIAKQIVEMFKLNGIRAFIFGSSEFGGGRFAFNISSDDMQDLEMGLGAYD